LLSLIVVSEFGGGQGGDGDIGS